MFVVDFDKKITFVDQKVARVIREIFLSVSSTCSRLLDKFLRSLHPLKFEGDCGYTSYILE